MTAVAVVAGPVSTHLVNAWQTHGTGGRDRLLLRFLLNSSGSLGA